MPTGGGLQSNPDGATKMSYKTHPHRNSGSAFDTTAQTGGLFDRVGKHTMNTNTPDPKAFTDHCMKTNRKNPYQFTRRGTGTGGMADSEAKRVRDTKLDQIRKDKEEHEERYGPSRRTQSAFEPRYNPPDTEFRKFYERGDLPVQMDHRGVANALMWKVDIDQLDYHHYLPIMFSGLRETEQPYQFMAEQGCLDLLHQGGQNKVLAVVPQLVIPLKEALNTRDPQVMVRTIKMVQELVGCGPIDEGGSLIGQALVPYYRQILPVLNIYLCQRENTGDKIVYGQQNVENLNELIEETLKMLERHGGPDAFINIKYMIPTFESAFAS